MENVDDLTDLIIVDKSAVSDFDEVIGHIEDIVLSAEFEVLHEHFLETHWQCFENTEENKLEYMNIFQDYTHTFEHFFVHELSRRMSNFNMQRFAEQLDKNGAFHDTMNYGEIYELLHSFTNFQTFKELMLDYRFKKEGHIQHLDFDILITKPISSTFNTDKLEPNCGLTVDEKHDESLD